MVFNTGHVWGVIISKGPKGTNSIPNLKGLYLILPLRISEGGPCNLHGEGSKTRIGICEGHGGPSKTNFFILALMAGRQDFKGVRVIFY